MQHSKYENIELLMVSFLQIFTSSVVLLSAIVHCTTLQMWTSTNQLLGQTSACNGCLYTESNTHRWHVQFDSAYVEILDNTGAGCLGYVSSTGYINNGGNTAGLCISCDNQATIIACAV